MIYPSYILIVRQKAQSELLRSSHASSRLKPEIVVSVVIGVLKIAKYALVGLRLSSRRLDHRVPVGDLIIIFLTPGHVVDHLLVLALQHGGLSI